ncbi:hypothetical protein L3Q67_45020 (plasmid) [Saccharothrix sp. AJ9571]|nr:hypothetical protein L3Q67_45020 [Saccharothrix sp. AJ9571]
MDALRNAGERGADAHYILKTENKPTTQEECEKHYQNLGGGTPSTNETGTWGEWQELHTSYFVDSCVSGEPRKPSTRPSPSAPDTPTTPPVSSGAPAPTPPAAP